MEKNFAKKTVGNYEIDEQIAKTNLFEIFSGRSLKNNEEVVIKCVQRSAEHFSKSSALLAKEQKLLEKISSRFVIAPKDYIENQDGTYLVLEKLYKNLADLDFNHIPIKQRLLLASKISDGLQDLHNLGIIHKDVKPSNVVISKDLNDVKLIDFGNSSEIAGQLMSESNTFLREGSLPYMSPEQTGRTQHLIDPRSDLYSFGVLLFELLTGQLPFNEIDSLDWVHCHIAKDPPTPSSINSEIGKPLDDLILKLMQKSPGDRYQSASGISYDLNEIWKIIDSESTDQIDRYVIGANDRPSSFLMKNKLFGREEEINTLHNGFINTCNDCEPKIAFVAGESGVGKTSLVATLKKDIVKKRGTFISGKSDQFKRNMPFVGIKQALKNYVDIILNLDDQNFSSNQKKIKKALGDLAPVLVDFVPDFDKILETSSKTIAKDPEQIKLALDFLFEALGTPESPLVIFIDDIQWADLGSLQWIENYALNHHNSVFFICAYRSNEISDIGPVANFRNRLIEANVGSVINLYGISETATSELISYSFGNDKGCPPASLKKIYTITKGNPLYIREIMTHLYKEDVLTYNLDIRSWVLDENAFANVSFSNNLIDVILEEIKKLDELTQNILAQAAIVGNTFTLMDLSLVSDYEVNQISHSLITAQKLSMIQNINPEFELTANTISKDFYANYRFRFSHDKIQQAASETLNDKQKEALHYKAAKINFSADNNKSLNSSQVLESVDHYSKCKPLWENSPTEEKSDIARLFLWAARIGNKNTSYEFSVQYAQFALEFFVTTTEQTPLRDCYHLLAKSFNHLNNYEEAIKYINEATKYSKTKKEKSEVLVTKAEILARVGNHKDGYYALADAIGVYGVKVRKSNFPLWAFITIALKLPIIYLGAKKVSGKNISKRNRLLFEDSKAVGFLMYRILQFGALAGLPYSAVGTALKFSAKIIKTGDPYLYVCSIPMTIVVCTNLGFHGISKLLSSIMSSTPIPKDTYYQNTWTQTSHIGTVTNDLEVIRAEGEKILDSAFSVGDITSIDFLIDHTYIELPFYLAKTKEQLKIALDKPRQFVKHMQPDARASYLMATAFFEALNSKSPAKFTKEQLEEINLIKKEKPIFTVILATYECHYNSILQNWNEVIDARLSIPIKNLLDGAFSTSAFHLHFYTSLAAGHLLNDSTKRKHNILLLKFLYFFGLMFFKLNKSANPERFSTFIKILEAAGPNKNHFKKITAVESAIKNCNNLGINWLTAITYNVASEVANSANLIESKNHFSQKETKSFEAYGFVENQLINKTPDHTAHTQTISQTLTQSANENLDFASIISTVNELSREIKYDSLIKKLLSSASSLAGADIVYLVLIDGKTQKPYVGAVLKAKQLEIRERNDHSQDINKIYVNAIQYCLRTQERIVINDINKDSRFENASYFESSGTKSMLLLPVVSKGKSKAILYFENHKMKGVFTDHIIKPLSILVSQMASSLENTELYEGLEQKVSERTSQLEARKRDMQVMLENIPQGIFTIRANKLIDAEYSKNLESIVMKNNIYDQNVEHVLFEFADINKNDLSQVNSALNAIMGEGELNYTLNAHLLPTKIKLTKENMSKDLEIDWQPIINGDQVEKLLVVVRDVTELNLLKAEANKKEKEIDVIIKILDYGITPFQKFIQSCQGFVSECSKLINEKQDTDFSRMFRYMHTLKGNARNLGLTGLVELAHIAEDRYSGWVDGRQFDQQSGLEDLKLIKEELLYYETIFTSKLKNIGGTSSIPDKFQKLLDSLEASLNSRSNDKEKEFEQILTVYKDLYSRSLTEIIGDEINGLADIAVQLGKPTPQIIVDSPKLRLSEETEDLLKNVFVHCLRNSIDHGIETSAIRESKGKSEAGNIFISCNIDEAQQSLKINIKDDGAGLNIDKIAEKTGSEGLPMLDLANMIFVSGVSTAKKVTDISGRGVGLDAVKSFLNEQGGDIKIDIIGDKLDTGHVPIEFNISIPVSNTKN